MINDPLLVLKKLNKIALPKTLLKKIGEGIGDRDIEDIVLSYNEDEDSYDIGFVLDNSYDASYLSYIELEKVIEILDNEGIN